MDIKEIYNDNGTHIKEVVTIKEKAKKLEEIATEYTNYINELKANGTLNKMDVYTVDYLINYVNFKLGENIESTLSKAGRTLTTATHYDDLDMDDLERMESFGELDEYRARFD